MTQAQGPAPRLLALAATLGILYAFRSVLWPLALAVVLAVLIGAIARRVTRILPRAGARTTSIVTAIIVGGLVIAAIATVVAGVTQMAGRIPAVYRRLDHIVGSLDIPGLGPFSLDQAVSQLDIGALAGSVIAAVQSAGGGLSLTVIYLVFLIVSSRMIGRRVAIIAATNTSGTLAQVLERTARGVEAYVYIQTITGLMMATTALVVMLAVGLDNALFWALALFLLSYLPIIGVMIGSLGPTIFALLQFATPVQAVIVFVAIQAIAFVVGNFILPKMQADSQNIDPTTSLLAIGVWTILWGVPGAFLAIPLTLTVMYALAQFPSVHWIAVLMSNDGDPLPRSAGESVLKKA